MLATMPEPDRHAGDSVRARAAEILRPAGALARLDELAAWVAEWQGTASPAVRRPAALIFAADHGVAAAGVSKYPSDVTAAMLSAYRAGKSTISAFAAVAGATVLAVDVGVGRPTGDIRFEPALSNERFDQACAAGREAVESVDADLLVLGEMGIGNTTAAAAVVAAISGGDTTPWVGRGTGVDDEGLARKRDAVRMAVERSLALAWSRWRCCAKSGSRARRHRRSNRRGPPTTAPGAPRRLRRHGIGVAVARTGIGCARPLPSRALQCRARSPKLASAPRQTTTPRLGNAAG